VACDKLILLPPLLNSETMEYVEANGRPSGHYPYHLDLSRTSIHLPVRVFCGGPRRAGIKVEVLGVRGLGHRATCDLVAKLCGTDFRSIQVWRVDWCIDLPGVSASEIATYCRVPNSQTVKFYHSRTGNSFYPTTSREKTILIYDRGSYLRSKRKSARDRDAPPSDLTRFEVQLIGQGVPFPSFEQLERFREIDVLAGVEFLKFKPIRPGLTTQQFLAAEALQTRIATNGLQAVLKDFPSSDVAYLISKYFRDADPDDLPDVRDLMQDSISMWLSDVRRFPRTTSGQVNR
jgi:hypothetical protein